VCFRSLRFSVELCGSICVARSLFEALCVRKGELCLPDSFLQLFEISEIISQLLNSLNAFHYFSMQLLVVYSVLFVLLI